jgi:hypothetical protein
MPISLARIPCALQYQLRMKFGSSFCRVTGVSSLNLARRSNELAGFFLFKPQAVSKAALAAAYGRFTALRCSRTEVRSAPVLANHPYSTHQTDF